MSTQSAVISRPHSRRKRTAILEAATRLFLRAGYGAATMDAIAQQAGVSKQTIYHHFGSKEALFGAIVSDLCESAMEPVDLARLQGGDVRAVLNSLARQVLELTLTPDSLALHRLIIAESPRAPELGAVTYAAGPRVAVATLARYLREQTANGRLEVTNPENAAEQFFGMVLGNLQLRALLGEAEPRLDDAWIDRWIAGAVDVFLAGHRWTESRIAER